jgi:hypothetical protein
LPVDLKITILRFYDGGRKFPLKEVPQLVCHVEPALCAGNLASIADANDANHRTCGNLSQIMMIGRVTPAAGVSLASRRCGRRSGRVLWAITRHNGPFQGQAGNEQIAEPGR